MVPVLVEGDVLRRREEQNSNASVVLQCLPLHFLSPTHGDPLDKLETDLIKKQKIHTKHV